MGQSYDVLYIVKVCQGCATRHDRR